MVIHVGLALPTYRSLATADNIRLTADKADVYGFHSVWAVDHVIVSPPMIESFGPVCYDPWATLAYIAGRSSRLHVGFSISPIAYRHPLQQAKSIATLDQLSGGRASYGGAAGYLESEFVALGLDFHKRGAMADEYLQAIRNAWTAEWPEWHGRFVDYSGVRCDPKPLQKPHPPIWVGGESDAAFRRAVRYGDGWHGMFNFLPTLEKLGDALDRLRAIAGREGRDPSTVRVSGKVDCRVSADAGGRLFFGPARKVADDLLRVAALGVEEIVFVPMVAASSTGTEEIDRLGEEVLPLLGARV